MTERGRKMKLDRTYKKRSDDQTNTMQNIILHYVREYNNAETVAEIRTAWSATLADYRKKSGAG